MKLAITGGGDHPASRPTYWALRHTVDPAKSSHFHMQATTLSERWEEWAVAPAVIGAPPLGKVPSVTRSLNNSSSKPDVCVGHFLKWSTYKNKREICQGVAQLNSIYCMCDVGQVLWYFKPVQTDIFECLGLWHKLKQFSWKSVALLNRKIFCSFKLWMSYKRSNNEFCGILEAIFNMQWCSDYRGGLGRTQETRIWISSWLWNLTVRGWDISLTLKALLGSYKSIPTILNV